MREHPFGSPYNKGIGIQAGSAQAEQPASLSLRSQLEHDVTNAEKALGDAKRALEIFNKNPDELEELVQIVQRRGW